MDRLDNTGGKLSSDGLLALNVNQVENGAGRISAKGGSGASMLACNLAHQLSVQGGRTLLLDLDMHAAA